VSPLQSPPPNFAPSGAARWRSTRPVVRSISSTADNMTIPSIRPSRDRRSSITVLSRVRRRRSTPVVKSRAMTATSGSDPRRLYNVRPSGEMTWADGGPRQESLRGAKCAGHQTIHWRPMLADGLMRLLAP